MTPAEIRAIPCPTEHDEGDDFEIMEAKESYIAGWEACADAIASRLEAARHVEAEQGEITEEWLLSVGFADCTEGLFMHGIGPLHELFLERDYDDDDGHKWIATVLWRSPSNINVQAPLPSRYRTRADVLNLLRALGIEATRT